MPWLTVNIAEQSEDNENVAVDLDNAATQLQSTHCFITKTRRKIEGGGDAALQRARPSNLTCCDGDVSMLGLAWLGLVDGGTATKKMRRKSQEGGFSDVTVATYYMEIAAFLLIFR